MSLIIQMIYIAFFPFLYLKYFTFKYFRVNNLINVLFY
jgi:hypothetical protein